MLCECADAWAHHLALKTHFQDSGVFGNAIEHAQKEGTAAPPPTLEQGTGGPCHICVAIQHVRGCTDEPVYRA